MFTSAPPVDGPLRSIGNAPRCGARCMSTHTLVAILYSHERSDERSSNRSPPFQARTSVSCAASSASAAQPSIR